MKKIGIFILVITSIFIIISVVSGNEGTNNTEQESMVQEQTGKTEKQSKKKKKSKKNKSKKKSSKKQKTKKKNSKKKKETTTSDEGNNTQKTAQDYINEARNSYFFETGTGDITCGQVLEEFFLNWKYEFKENEEDGEYYVIFTGRSPGGTDVYMVYVIEITWEGEVLDGEWETATISRDGFEQEGEEVLGECFWDAYSSYAENHNLDDSEWH